jgi:hypothetical protein
VVVLRAVWCDRRWTWRDSVAAIIYLAICVVGPLLVTYVPGHAVLKVTSVGQWLHVFCHVLAWPANGWLGAAVVLQLPLVAFLLGRLRARRLDGPDAVLLGLALWGWGQVAAVAYSRGNLGMGNSPRYYDLYAIGIALNAIALARGWRDRAAKVWPVVAVVWVAALAYGLREQTAQAYRDYLTPFPSVKATERHRLADFIRTGDLAALRRAPEELPYISADALAGFLSHPGMRRLLPVSLRPPLAIQAVAGETRGFARTPPYDLPGKPEDATAWHAARGPAKFVSEPLPADCLPVLYLTFAGSPELSPGVLYLESVEGRRTALQIARFRGDRWQTAHLPLPARSAVRLVVELPPGDHWLAFADPVEMGRGSWYVYNLLKRAGGIFWGCAGLLALALAALGWREPPEGGWRRIGVPWWEAQRGWLVTIPGESRRHLHSALDASRALMQAWLTRIAAWPRPAQIAVGVVLLAGALFLRKPDALLNPQFWAEDGSVFFLENDLYGIGAWLHPYAGYLHLVPRMGAWALSFADPRWLPALYSAAAFLIWVAVIARCWAPRLELPAKAWLPVAFLFAAYTLEILFVLTNVIWITAFLLLQQVFMRPPARWWGWMLELALIGIVALTGPFALMLWPLFVWSFWRRRTSYSAAVLTVVTIACLIQLGCLLQAPAGGNHLSEVFDSPGQVFPRIIQRTIALYLGGAPLALALSSGVLIGIGIAVTLLWLVTTRRPPVDRAVWCAVSFALVAMLAANLYRGSPYADIGMGDRYYFIPRVLVGWLLIWLAVGGTRGSRLARVVAVLAVCVNLPGYRLPPATDYHWAQNCAPLRRGQPAKIPILPDGWILQYPGRPPR